MTRLTVPLALVALALALAGCTHATARTAAAPAPTASASTDANVARGCALAETLTGVTDLIGAGDTITRVHALTVDAPHEVQADAEILYEDWQSARQAPPDMRASANDQLFGPVGMVVGACQGSGY